MPKNKKMMMLMSIVQLDMGKKLINMLKQKGIKMHFQSVGYGTAPTEMMDIFGLCNNNKDLIISIGPENIVKKVVNDFNNKFEDIGKYGGLMMIFKMSAINRLIMEILNHDIEIEQLKGENFMKNEYHNNLILISVNNGFADDVMEVARKSGATGGTVIKGRMSDFNQLIELGQVHANEERELICILAPQKVGEEILENVNSQFGAMTEANGILCAIPTEKAYKI